MTDEKEKSDEIRPTENDEEDRQNLVQSDEAQEKNVIEDEVPKPLDKDETQPPQSGTRPTQYYILHQSEKRTCHMPRSEGVNVKARRKLIIASALCFIFIIVQVIGGIFSNSLAIAADAAHTLTDFAGFMISLFAIWLAGRNPTDRLSFGWHRAEVIGALASVMTIWCVTAVLVWLAIQRCINREFEIESVIMMLTAVFGFVTNIALAVILLYNSSQTEINCESNEIISTTKKSSSRYGHGHGHGHGHSHGCSGRAFEKFENKMKIYWRKLRRSCGKKYIDKRDTFTTKCRHENQQNINVRAAFLHVLGDGLQSVGVLLAGIIIYFRPDWVLADPICTFIFAILVLYTTIQILKDIVLVLMEGTPTYMDYNEVQEIFKSIEGVKSVHGLRIWALNIDKIALTVHLVTERNIDAKAILDQAEQAIHTHYKLYETTIQIEEEN